jgi:opacity protein-like surface antigen
MRVTRLSITIFVAALWMLGTAYAQYPESSRFSHIDFSAGGGFTEPTGHAGNNLNMGWNLDFRGGYRPSSKFALDLDFNYNRWNLNNAALARVGEPGGYMTIWSTSFDPTFSAPTYWHFSPYVFGGPGLYYRNLSLTAPGLVNTFVCDPFFGFCYPASVGVNQIVSSNTTYKLGVNFGAGLEFRLGQSHAKVFGEARYSRMFTTHGSDISFVPVTFGLRW